MKTKMRTFALGIVLLALLAATQPARAKGLKDGKVVFGQDFTLQAGQELSGDLVVLGGNVWIEADSSVLGSVVVIGGQLSNEGAVAADVVVVGGQVQQAGGVGQDLVVIGGQVDLQATAVVEGDVVAVGGQVSRAAGASVQGDLIEPFLAPQAVRPATPDGGAEEDDRTPPRTGRAFGWSDPFNKAASVLFRSFAMAALGTLLAVFLEPQLQRAGRFIVQQPVLSGSIGLVTAILLPVALLVMVITVLLIPVALLVLLLVILAWLFGMLAIGYEIGERIERAAKTTWPPILSAGLGTFLLFLVLGAVEPIPCVGPLASFLLGLTAMGGTLLVWLGSGRRAAAQASSTPMKPKA